MLAGIFVFEDDAVGSSPIYQLDLKQEMKR